MYQTIQFLVHYGKRSRNSGIKSLSEGEGTTERITQEHSSCGTDSGEPTWMQVSRVNVSLRGNCHLLRYWIRVISVAIALGGVIMPSSQKLEIKKPLTILIPFYFYLFLSSWQTLHCLGTTWSYVLSSWLSPLTYCFFRKRQMCYRRS